ncbi:hypothetical protein CCP3SC1AL1_3800004 [Gammaproteobacteria bacterium]
MTYCYCIKVVVIALERHWDFVVIVFFVARIEPCVGFGDFFEAQGDHAAQVALGVDFGEVVCHGVTLVGLAFFV